MDDKSAGLSAGLGTEQLRQQSDEILAVTVREDEDTERTDDDDLNKGHLASEEVTETDVSASEVASEPTDPTRAGSGVSSKGATGVDPNSTDPRPGAYSHSPGSEPVLQPQASSFMGSSNASLKPTESMSSQSSVPPPVSMVEERSQAVSSLGESLTTSQVLTAEKVTEDPQDVEAQVRNRILQEAVQADVVEESAPSNVQGKEGTEGRKKWWVVAVAAVVLIGLVLGLSLGLTGGDDSSEDDSSSPALSPVPEEALWSTLETVRQRGSVRCGMEDTLPGFALGNISKVELEGLNADQCRAVSLAVFGTADRLEPVLAFASERFQLLGNGTIDLIAETVTHTMGRDVFEGASQSGFTFSDPYVFVS